MAQSRIPLLLFAFITLLVFVSGKQSAAQSVETMNRERDSMVIVSSNIGPHQDAIGAGVVVAVTPTHLRVITARHVADRGPVTIWIDRWPHPAEIVRTFSDRDLAVVDAYGAHFDRLALHPAVIADATSPGSILSIWGEDTTGLRNVRGAVISTAYSPGDRTGTPLLSFICDACSPGDSGAGVFDRTGHLLAVLTARYYGAHNRTIAIVGEPVDASLYLMNEESSNVAATPPK